ncbi:hypothetical protein ACFQJ7_13910 [Halovenus rubra]|uniref:Uncharacterized protein n=2 Tax=Halovenus rubra TaxID=869890 RepID=A0ACC7E139_9EURY|nr:hypothetical protein [Halovenus rubra]
MRECPNCRAEIDPSEKYCPECRVGLEKYDVREAVRSAEERQYNQGRWQRAERNPPQRESQKQDSSRREFLAGFGTTFILGSGVVGWFALPEGSDRPGKPAEDFIEALGERDFSEANELVHSEATIGGAGTAWDVLSESTGADVMYEVRKISFVDSNLIEEGEKRAVVAVTVNIDAGIDETEGDIRLVMRKDNDEWRVWNIRA